MLGSGAVCEAQRGMKDSLSGSILYDNEGTKTYRGGPVRKSPGYR